MRVTRVAGLSAGALLSGLSAAAAYGSVAKNSQLFGPTAYRGVGARKSVALTFDDGPSESTVELLEYLEKEEIKLIDCQVYTKHLESLGAEMISRKEFLQLLKTYV